MFSFLRGIFGWFALVLIAVAIAIAQFLGGFKWIRRILWAAAALFAVAAAINEWSTRK